MWIIIANGDLYNEWGCCLWIPHGRRGSLIKNIYILEKLSWSKCFWDILNKWDIRFENFGDNIFPANFSRVSTSRGGEHD